MRNEVICTERKTVGNIRKWIGPSIIQHFANDSRANVMWKKPENMYERKVGIDKYTTEI